MVSQQAMHPKQAGSLGIMLVCGSIPSLTHHTNRHGLVVHVHAGKKGNFPCVHNGHHDDADGEMSDLFDVLPTKRKTQKLFTRAPSST